MFQLIIHSQDISDSYVGWRDGRKDKPNDQFWAFQDRSIPDSVKKILPQQFGLSEKIFA